LNGGLWRRLWRETRGYRWAVALLLGLEIVAVPLALATPIPLAIAVDSAIGDAPVPGWLNAITPAWATATPEAIAATAAVLVVVIATVEHLRGIASWLLGTWTGGQLLLRLRARLFRHTQRMSLAYHDGRGTSDATFRIQYDAAAVQQLATEGLNPVVTSCLTLLAMVWVTAQLDLVVAAIALSTIPALVFVTRRYQRRLRDGWSDVKNDDSRAMAVMHESLGSLRVVKAFGAESRETRRFHTQARRTLEGQLRMAFLESTLWMAIGILMALCSAAVLYVGVRHVQQGDLSVGDMLVVIAYAAMISGPLERLARHVGDLQSSLGSAQRAYELLDQPEDVPERPDARPVKRVTGTVEFQNVTFHYGVTGGGVEDVSFTVRHGESIGLAGPTGAGKTTLMGLLVRFYDPASGRVLVDEVDIRDYRVADHRNQFAIVLQEPVLFSTTIGDNIAYGLPRASRFDVEQAARSAEAHDFITALPDGYNTVLGERGSTLSGGQRQRLSLARAFLRDAPILILDEPTSAVDSATEQRIMSAVNRLIANRTTFVISHRSSVIDMCDRTLFVRDGHVTDRPTLQWQAPRIGEPLELLARPRFEMPWQV
jgi:ATP-binding cassette subfamily B protein